MNLNLYAYEKAIELHPGDWPFSSLIAAAMLKADDVNMAKLRSAWPDVYDDLVARYNAPGGLLEEEQGDE